MIREAIEKDIPALVAIHMAALPNDFLPRLGSDFLQKIFYPIALGFDQAVTLVSVEDAKANGFVIFAYKPKALTRQLMKEKVMLTRYLFLGLRKDLSLIREISAIICGFNTNLFFSLDIDIAKIPELYLIATTPDMQSKGIGNNLVSMGLEILHKKEHPYCLVKTSSERAKLFYLKQGFEVIGEEYRQKRKLFLMMHGIKHNLD